MKSWMHAPIAIGVMLLVSSTLPAAGQTTCNIAPPISTAVLDWLTQHVCSVSGTVQNTDPCSCPTSGGSLPRLTVGEDLPYHKWDQLMAVRHDSFLTQDVNSNYWVINTEARNTGLDGYTVYRSDNLHGKTGWSAFPTGFWASSDGTKDSINFSTSIWGCPANVTGTPPNNSDCLPYGGWVFFPDTFLTSISNGSVKNGGTATTPSYEHDRRWEHDSQYYSGAFPLATINPNNTYTYLTNLTYGGPSTSTQKKIADSIQALHGTPGDTSGHLEILYFTQLYGFTRWEAWAPVGQWTTQDKYSSTLETYGSEAQSIATSSCNPTIGTLNTSGTYAGAITTTFPSAPTAEYFLHSCADYTNVTTTGDSTPPAWPVPEMNLLSNPHFTVATPSGTGPWGGASSTGWSTVGSPLFAVQASTLTADNKIYDYATSTWDSLCDADTNAPDCGVNYATLQAGSGGLCAGSTTGTCSLYSNITLPSGMTAGNTYWINFGAHIALNSSSSASSANVTFVVDQLNCSSGCSIIPGASVTVPFTIKGKVLPNNSTPPSGSVVLDAQLAPSTCFANCNTSNEIDVPEPQQITIASGATELRLAIQFQPQTGVIFDISQAWLQYLP